MPVPTASAYRMDRAEEGAQREAKEDLSKKGNRRRGARTVCLSTQHRSRAEGP